MKKQGKGGSIINNGDRTISPISEMKKSKIRLIQFLYI